MKRITLNEAIKFHGHLGPYLVLGLLAGESAIKKLKCKKYFGLDVSVYGANKKPKSCLIDGIQLSSGATYGKGNVHKFNGPMIRVEFNNRLNGNKVTLKLKQEIIKILGGTKTHKECEVLAKKLYKINHNELFDFATNDKE